MGTRRRLSQADRDTAVKTAIKEVMGLDNDPSDVDVEKYKLDAVKDSVLETVEACNEETKESTTTTANSADRKAALKQCREATAKKEIADMTGKPENDITPTDLRRTIKHATKSRIRDVLKEVEKIPKNTKAEKDTFRNDQIKKAMKEVMGKDDDEDPTDIEIERFKEDGVQDTVRETIDACNSEARDETDVTVRETKYKACRSQTVRQTMADITGKNSSEITALNIEKYVEASAVEELRITLDGIANKKYFQRSVGRRMQSINQDDLDFRLAIRSSASVILGGDVDGIEGTTAHKFVREARRRVMKETLEACNADAREKTVESEKRTRFQECKK